MAIQFSVTPLGNSPQPDAEGRLKGVVCEGLADAMAAGDAGANFVVLAKELPAHELKSLCELVPIPVYTPGLALEEAWAVGASGVSEPTVSGSHQKSA